MISKAVTQYAAENGYKFFINGFGYRKLAEITDLEGNHVSWTSNKSDCARNSINSLIQQKRLAAKSNEAIATEASEAISDLLPPVVAIDETVAEQAYQELLPVVVGSWEQRHAERFASQELIAEELIADGFVSTTYMTRDTFGDDAFVFSARHGCGALI